MNISSINKQLSCLLENAVKNTQKVPAGIKSTFVAALVALSISSGFVQNTQAGEFPIIAIGMALGSGAQALIQHERNVHSDAQKAHDITEQKQGIVVLPEQTITITQDTIDRVFQGDMHAYTDVNHFVIDFLNSRPDLQALFDQKIDENGTGVALSKNDVEILAQMASDQSSYAKRAIEKSNEAINKATGLVRSLFHKDQTTTDTAASHLDDGTTMLKQSILQEQSDYRQGHYFDPIQNSTGAPIFFGKNALTDQLDNPKEAESLPDVPAKVQHQLDSMRIQLELIARNFNNTCAHYDTIKKSSLDAKAMAMNSGYPIDTKSIDQKVEASLHQRNEWQDKFVQARNEFAYFAFGVAEKYNIIRSTPELTSMMKYLVGQPVYNDNVSVNTHLSFGGQQHPIDSSNVAYKIKDIQLANKSTEDQPPTQDTNKQLYSSLGH